MLEQKKQSLRKKIVSLFVSISALPLLVFSLIYLFNVYRFEYRELQADKERVLKLVSDTVDKRLRHIADDLITVSSILENSSELNFDRAAIYEKMYSAHRHFLKIQFADSEGIIKEVFPYDENIIGNDISRQEYYYKTKDQPKIFWSSTYISNQLNQAVVSINKALDGGVLTAVVALDEVTSFVDKLQLGRKSSLGLVDENGFYVAHSDKLKVMRRDYNVNFERFVEVGRKTLKFNYSRDVHYDVYVVPVPFTDWSIWVEQDTWASFHMLYNNILFALILLFVVILFVVKIARVKANGINDVLLALQKRIRQVRSGDYSIEESEEEFEEIAELRDGINSMVKSIVLRQDALLESHEKYRALYWEAQEAFMIVSPREGFVSANPATLKLFGYEKEEEFVKLRPGDISPEYQNDGLLSVQKAHDMMQEALDNGSNFFDWIHKRKNGELFEATVFLTKVFYGNRDVLYATVRDITETKKMRELIVQTEKMMSVGNLAAGMAHEINNPLGVILQSAQNIKRRLKNDVPANVVAAQECGIDLEKVREYLEKRSILRFLDAIADVGNRAAEIVSNMLQFSRQSDKKKVSSEISSIVDDVILLAQKDYDLESNYDFKHVLVEKKLEPGIRVVVVRTEIEQVLFNLLKNAAQALTEVDSIKKPTIKIKTYRTTNNAVIEISDNGPGMDEELKKHIFEPFFTTKVVGVGTGLGLSVSYFIITQSHGGHMYFESHKGEGTTFFIELPLE